MKVLSLFDGMSCGQIALRELNIIPEVYYASEIDKYAIAQTQINFPNTVQVGDVNKWKEWDIEWKEINLILAGSPCQGFSFAGKQLAFEDPRSALFFVFIEILNYCRTHNPDVLFLLENVNMKREYMGVISDYCGIVPVNINSTLLSAQNRDRWYWSTIRTKKEGLFEDLHTDIPQPKDRRIFLKDILEDEVDEKYYLSNKALERIIRKNYSKPRINPDKAGTLNTKNNSGELSVDAGTTLIFQRPRGKNKGGIYSEKSPTLSSFAWEQNNVLCVAMRGRNLENSDPSSGTRTTQRLEPNITGKTNCLTSVAKDNLIVQLNPSKESNGKQPYQHNRVYDINAKSPALTAELSLRSNAILDNDFRIRRLTPTECSRLQTIPDWYVWKCSETQIYRMLGNGWTVEIIKHILQYLKPFSDAKS